MKKIVFFMPIFQTGGIERVLSNIVKSLYEKYKIEIIIDQKPVDCQILDDIRALNVPITVLSKFEIPTKPKNFIKRKLWRMKYGQLLKNKDGISIATQICSDADLIIDFFSSNMHYIVSKINLPIPRVVWFHCSIKIAQSAKLFQRLPDYQKIIGLTKIFCDELKELYPYMDIEYIGNPIDVEKILHQKELKLPKVLKDKEYFVSVARLSEDKDVQTLIRAYKIFLDKTNSSTLLCLLGSGNREKEIRDLVEELGIKNKVIFAGSQNNPYPFMSKAKACILSSKSEASPCVLVEAMVCKTLPVCSDCPTGPKELLDYGKRGILFPVEDYNALADILEKIDNSQIKKSKYSAHWDEYIRELSIDNFEKTFYSAFFKKKIEHPVIKKRRALNVEQQNNVYFKLFDLLPVFKYQKTEHSVALYLFDFIPLFKYKYKTKYGKL